MEGSLKGKEMRDAELDFRERKRQHERALYQHILKTQNFGAVRMYEAK